MSGERLDPVAGAVWEAGGTGWPGPAAIARAILDSTDPAVHAAMLDALTRHGVLTEEVMNKPIFRERTLDPAEVRMVGQNGDATVTYVERWADQRRLVTSWEVLS